MIEHPAMRETVCAAHCLLSQRGRHDQTPEERQRAEAAAARLRAVSGVELALILHSAELLRPLDGWSFSADS